MVGRGARALVLQHKANEQKGLWRIASLFHPSPLRKHLGLLFLGLGEGHGFDFDNNRLVVGAPTTDAMLGRALSSASCSTSHPCSSQLASIPVQKLQHRGSWGLGRSVRREVALTVPKATRRRTASKGSPSKTPFDPDEDSKVCAHGSELEPAAYA
eukprot:1147995-Pelagomonas_calceolata.AAC.8